MRRIWMVALTMALTAAACSDGDEEVSATPEVVVAGDASSESESESESNADDGEAEGTDSGDGTDDSDDAANSDEEQALDFVQCMRDNGVDMADPTVDADGSVNLTPPGGPGGDDIDEDVGQAAFDACSDRLEGASFLPSDDDLTDIEDQLLEVAQCLRDEGIDVDDPDLSGGIAGTPGGPFGPDFDPDDPATAAAIDVCSGLFTGIAPGGQGS